MPRVPVYGQNQLGGRAQHTLVALPPAYQDIRTNVEMFGAGEARALEAAGIGLGNLGDTIGAIAEDRLAKANEAAAGQARATLNDYVAESLYGKDGFMGREGEAAVGDYPRQQADFDRRVRELQDGLPTAEAQRQFRETTQDQVLQARRAVARHVGGQRERLHARIADAELASATGLALKVYADPEMLKQALAEGAGVIRRHNAERGLPDHVSADQIAGFTQGVFDQIVGRVAEENPGLIAALGRPPLMGEGTAGEGAPETSTPSGAAPSEAPLWWQGASDAARDAALASADRQIDDRRLMFRADINRRIKTEIQHHRAGLVTPSEAPVTRADIDAAYGPDQAGRIWDDLQQDRMFGDLMRGFAMRGPAEIQAMLDEARVEAEEQGGAAAGRYALMRHAATADAKARQRSPAAYVIARSAGLRALWGMQGPDGDIGDLTPDEMRSAMRATWEAQAEIGIPVADRRAMPDQAAAAFAGRWLKETDPEARLDSLLTVIQPTKDLKAENRFVDQLIEGGVSDQIKVVLKIARDPLRRQAALSAMKAMTTKAPEVDATRDSSLRPEIQSAWLGSPGPLRWLNALFRQDDAALQSAVREKAVLDRVARQEMVTGDEQVAAEKAASVVFGSPNTWASEVSALVAEGASKSLDHWKRGAEFVDQPAFLQLLTAVLPVDWADPELHGADTSAGERTDQAEGISAPGLAPAGPTRQMDETGVVSLTETRSAAEPESGSSLHHQPEGGMADDRDGPHSMGSTENQGDDQVIGIEGVSRRLTVHDALVILEIDPTTEGVYRQQVFPLLVTAASSYDLNRRQIRQYRSLIRSVVESEEGLEHLENTLLEAVDRIRRQGEAPIETMTDAMLFRRRDFWRSRQELFGDAQNLLSITGTGRDSTSRTDPSNERRLWVRRVAIAARLATRSPVPALVLGGLEVGAGVMSHTSGRRAQRYDEEIRRRSLTEPPLGAEDIDPWLPLPPHPGALSEGLPISSAVIPYDPREETAVFDEVQTLNLSGFGDHVDFLFLQRGIHISRRDAAAIMDQVVAIARDWNTPVEPTLRWLLWSMQHSDGRSHYAWPTAARFTNGSPIRDAAGQLILLRGRDIPGNHDEETAIYRMLMMQDEDRQGVEMMLSEFVGDYRWRWPQIRRLARELPAELTDSSSLPEIDYDAAYRAWRDDGPSIQEEPDWSGPFFDVGERLINQVTEETMLQRMGVAADAAAEVARRAEYLQALDDFSHHLLSRGWSEERAYVYARIRIDEVLHLSDPDDRGSFEDHLAEERLFVLLFQRFEDDPGLNELVRLFREAREGGSSQEEAYERAKELYLDWLDADTRRVPIYLAPSPQM